MGRPNERAETGPLPEMQSLDTKARACYAHINKLITYNSPSLGDLVLPLCDAQGVEDHSQVLTIDGEKLSLHEQDEFARECLPDNLKRSPSEESASDSFAPAAHRQRVCWREGAYHVGLPEMQVLDSKARTCYAHINNL